MLLSTRLGVSHTEQPMDYDNGYLGAKPPHVVSGESFIALPPPCSPQKPSSSSESILIKIKIQLLGLGHLPVDQVS